MGRRAGSVNKVDIENLPRGVTFLKDGRARPWMVRHRNMKAETFATPEAAVQRKKELIGLEKNHGSAAIEYSREIHADAKQALDVLPDGVSCLDAARFYVLHHSTVEMRVDEAAEAFIEFKRQKSVKPEGWTPHTRNLKFRLKPFSDSFENELMSNLTADSVYKWLLSLKNRKGEPLSPRSIANYRINIGGFFNYAVRRNWITKSPMDDISTDDLPTVRGSRKNPLSVAQANTLLEAVSEIKPQYLIHFALRLFAGMRSAETNRFMWEWINRDEKTIKIPGYVYSDDDSIDQGSKTGDDWLIQDVPSRFWKFYDLEKRPTTGQVPKPYKAAWGGWKRKDGTRAPGLRDHIVNAMRLKKWPENTTRDTFCTLHISAYRDPKRTALVLKHTNSQTLWRSYLGTLVDQKAAVKFFEG